MVNVFIGLYYETFDTTKFLPLAVTYRDGWGRVRTPPVPIRRAHAGGDQKLKKLVVLSVYVVNLVACGRCLMMTQISITDTIIILSIL